MISVRAPSNAEIHEHVFYIYYIDDQKMKWFDMSSKTTLSMSHQNYLEDESIIGIDLLYRNLQSGFARQNGLLPGVWVNAYFGGDMPAVISGEITNLEEDMIEITTYPGYKTIYIDFAYCGLPEDLALDKIAVVDHPVVLKNISLREMMDNSTVDSTTREEAEEATAEYDATNGEFILHIPESIANTHQETFHDLVGERIDADDFVEGEVLGEETVMVEVLESERRYSLEAQLSDLMGTLVSKVPVEERTPQTLEKIRLIVSRYNDLREHFSEFDENRQVVGAKQTGYLYKPSIDHILNADMNLGWLIPVVYEPRELVDYVYATTRSVVHDQYGRPEPLEYDKITTGMRVQGENEDQNENTNQNTNSETIGEQATNYVSYRYSAEQNAYDAKMRLMDTMTGHTTVKPTPNRPHLFTVEPKLPFNVILDSSNKHRMESAVSKKLYTPPHIRDSKKFVMKTYLPGETRLYQKVASKTRIKMYVRDKVTNPEKMVVRSFLALPEAFFTFQYVNSASASIDLKSRLARHPPFLYRALKSATRVKQVEVNDLDAEIEYVDYNQDTDKNNKQIPFLNKVTQYTLNPRVDTYGMSNQEVAQKMLNAVIPRTRTLMKWLEPKLEHVYNYVSIIKGLEPFGIYEWNITFRQYMEARYFVKQQIKALNERLSKESREYRDYARTTYDSIVKPINRVYDMVKNDAFTHEIAKSAYLFSKDKDTSDVWFPSEYMARMETMDGADIYAKLIQHLMIKLISPNEIMERLDDIDTSDKRMFQSGKCINRSIAKKYESESALQKDNGADTVYYDKEYDDTPYHILQMYKKEKARFKEPSEFVEFLEDKLIREHDCPSQLAPELAATMIAGKKTVRDGEYAVLYVTPKLVASPAEIGSLSEKDKRDMVTEAMVRAKTTYYRRMKNQWVSDNTVDETSFIDNNTLFCNLAADCTKQLSTGQCLPNVSASIQMRLAKRNKMMEEFEKRAAKTVEEMTNELNAEIMEKFEKVSRFAVIRETKEQRQNNYSYELGKYVSRSNEQAVVSPYASVFQKVLGLPDFVKIQAGILAVVFHFCVEATESQDQHWFYCKDSGAKLVPVSLYRLASSFRRGTYAQVLEDVCREYGTLSDDGDSIEDKYTGYFLKKIEYSTDEGYDEEGFQIRTRSVVADPESNIATMVQRALAQNQPKDNQTKVRVFADKTMQMAYNVYTLLAKSIGINDETNKQPVASQEIEEFVIRTTMECMNDSKIVFLTEPEYVAKMSKKQKPKKGDKDADINVAPSFAPFETYRNQTLVVLVAASLHISIQTLIPTFKTKTHFSGCIQSFDGYPLDPNAENAIGIKYMACVLGAVKRGSEQPWKSVEKIGVDSMAKRMRMVIGEYLVKRADIDALYRAKREYSIMHPEEDVPAEVSLGRWTHFLPPLVAFDMKKPPSSITPEFEKEFFSAVRKGSIDQHASLRVMEAKLTHFSYGLFHAIQSIVETKRAALTTAGGRAFLENACCNEPGSEPRPLVYFMAQNPNLEILMKKASRVALVLNKVRQMNRAPLFFAPESSRITYPPLPDNIMESTIYQAYIFYCKFDSDEPIPAYLETVCTEKPKYDRTLSLKEKIQYMRKHGKDYGLDQFYALMRAVHLKRDIPIAALRKEYEPTHSIAGFLDILTYFDMDKPSPVVERNLVHLIQAVTSAFDGKTAHTDLSADEKRLKSYLLRVNREMSSKIESFLVSNSVVYTTAELNEIKKMVREPSSWTFTTHLKDIAQQVMNSMNRLSRVYASMLLNRQEMDESRTSKMYANWGFAPEHVGTLMREHHQFFSDFLASHVCVSSTDQSEYASVIRQVMRDTRDLVLFMEQIPIFSAVHVFDETKQTTVPADYLFEYQTTRLLFEYAWISVVYQYVVVALDPTYNHIQSTIRANEQADLDDIFGDDLDEDETGSRRDGGRLAISEVQIEQTENLDLRHQVAKMLFSLLLAENKIKRTVDLDYGTIKEKTERLKYSDKKRITDYLAKMTTDERRVEMNLKKSKLGRWDVGLKSSLFKYDKATWDKEKAEWTSDESAQLVYTVPQELSLDAEDIEREQARDANQAAYLEANDISGLGEDYMDGAYYEEDVDREDEY